MAHIKSKAQITAAFSLAEEIAKGRQDSFQIEKLLKSDDELRKLVSQVNGRWTDSGLQTWLEKMSTNLGQGFCHECGKPKKSFGKCEACGHENALDDPEASSPKSPQLPTPVPPRGPPPLSNKSVKSVSPLSPPPLSPPPLSPPPLSPPLSPPPLSPTPPPDIAAPIVPEKPSAERFLSASPPPFAPSRPPPHARGAPPPLRPTMPPRSLVDREPTSTGPPPFPREKPVIIERETSPNQKPKQDKPEAKESKKFGRGGDYSGIDASAVVVEAPQPILPVPDEKGLKFSAMTADFPSVYNQASAGLKQITAMKEMVQRLVKIEQENAKRMEKALAEESQRMGKVMESDGIIMFSGVWNELLMALTEKAECTKQISEKITEQVIEPLVTLEKTATMSLKSIATNMKIHEQEFKKVVESMNKSKDTCKRSLQSMQEAYEKEKAELNPKKRLEWGDKIVSVRKQAAEQAAATATKVAEANRASDVFSAGVRGCLDQLEELELQRLTQITLRLDRWVTCIRDTDAEQAVLSSRAADVVNEIDPAKCLRTYIFDWMIDFGEPSPVEPFVYDLPLSASEITAGSVMSKGFQMFNLPLTQLLEKEKSSGGDLALMGDKHTSQMLLRYQDRIGRQVDVPVIFLVLCEAIRTMGGLTTPNIFRTSIDVNLLSDLQRQFDVGNFDLKLMKGDPHAAASLMKLWLRSLTEPLINRSFYQQATQGLQTIKNNAVDVRRETRMILGAKGAAAPGARLPPDKAPDSVGLVMSIFNKQAPQCQALIRCLTNFVQEVVAHSDKNLMTHDSLAVAFAPAFFRSPKPEDQMEGMQQAQREKVFVAELFVALLQQKTES